MKVRRILIPAVAGLLISPALMAADLANESTGRTFSNEYMGTAGAADVVSGDVLGVELQAEYAVGDIITLSFSGMALDDSTLETSVTVADGALSGLTVGLLNSSDSEAVYRVTEIVPGVANSTVGVVLPFAAADVLEFNAQAVDAAGGVTVSFAAETDGGLALDTSGGDDRSVDYLELESEYDAEVTIAFDETVDVETDREELLGGPDDEGETTLTNAVLAAGETAFVDQDIDWAGNFSWIIDDDEVADDIQPLAGVVTVAGCADIVVTATNITATCPAGAASLVLDPSANDDGDGLRVLPATSYTVTVTVNYTGFGGTEGSVSFVLDGGEWVLNGYQALIPYMPYGSGIGQVIYLANRGTQAGDVTVDWIGLNGTSGSLGVIATLEAGTTLSIGPLIKAALTAPETTNGRLAITVTANVPAGDVQMNSQYNASGNRAFTLHKDNADD